MAVDEKISQLPEALTLDSEDVVPIVQVSTGLNKKVKVSTLLQDAGFIKDIVFKYDVDTVLEIGKINWVAPTADHTMSVPTADASNLGKILIVNNRSIYELTITGVVVTPLIVTGVNSIVGLVCVTNGYSYGWEVFSRYDIGDVDLGSKKITANDVTVSSATASTIAHFDATKNIESLPLSTYPSLTELSYVKGVTSAIQTQLNARSTAYAIPNYYRVDLNLGDDLTGVAGREDKPYRLIQTVWDLITTGSTTQITIEIVGDYTFTTHALLTSVNKDNITFLFKGKIVYAVPATTGSRPLFTFTGTNNNLTFIVPNYTQTTQGGFINTATSSGHRYIIDNMQILLGINTSTVNNWGFNSGGATNECYFQCNNLTVSLTGDGSGIKGYLSLFQFVNCNYSINTFKITGTSSVASSNYYGFYYAKSIYIENLIADNTYTNLTTFYITYTQLVCDNVFINSINISAGGTTTMSANRSLFNGTIKNLTIMSGSILNYSVITSETTSIENVNLGHLTINGAICRGSNAYFLKNINLLGNITKTVANQNGYRMIELGQGGQVNGNGFKIFHADPTYISDSAVIEIYAGGANSKATFINNLTIYNTNMITNDANPAFVPIMYYWTFPVTLRCRNLVVSSNNDAHTHANTSFIRPTSESTSYICRIEGNVATNYVKNFTNLTNDADIDLINGYRL